MRSRNVTVSARGFQLLDEHMDDSRPTAQPADFMYQSSASLTRDSQLPEQGQPNRCQKQGARCCLSGHDTQIEVGLFQRWDFPPPPELLTRDGLPF
jgi:hypothetical protein